MSLLELKGLKVSYGGIHAVKGIDLSVKQGQLVSLIGANGAGKTTTMKAITGGLAWAGGEVYYQGQSIAGVGADVLLKRGLAMVPEGRGIFMRMTVEENLLMGAYIRDDQAQINADLERMYSFFPRLKERLGQLAGTLSGGEQQMVWDADAVSAWWRENAGTVGRHPVLGYLDHETGRLTANEVLELANISRATLTRWMDHEWATQRGFTTAFPAGKMRDGKTKLWDRSTVEDWLNENKQRLGRHPKHNATSIHSRYIHPEHTTGGGSE